MSDLNFDVLVVGGGAAGVTAALAAARSGVRVGLIDVRPFVGGNAASGLCIHTYVTRFGKQVVFGIAHEFIVRLQREGGAVGHLRYHGRFHTVTPVDGDKFRVLVTRMLNEAGVTVLFQTPLVEVSMEGRRIKSASVALKGGLATITAKVFVDASGDGDLAIAAGAGYRKGDGKTVPAMQPVSIMLRCYGTRNQEVADGISPNLPRAMARRPEYDEPFPAYFAGSFSPWNDVLRQRGLFSSDDQRATFTSVWPDELNMNSLFVIGVDGTDSEAVAAATIQLTRQAEDVGRFLRDCVPGFSNSRFIPAAFIGVRETRNIRGLYEVSDEDVLQGLKHADTTIGQGCFPVDIKDPVSGKGRFTEIGDDGAFGIPYGALVAAELDNVLLAGRCISASYVANGSTRNMAACMVTGQAAGTAAAMCAEKNNETAAVDIRDLQSKLLSDGVYLGE